MGTVAIWLWLAVSSLPDAGTADAGLSAPVESVSLVQLIARPEEYNGARVRILAYMSIGFEECAVYLHKEDSDVGNTSNGLWLDLHSRPEAEQVELARKRVGWVIIEGTFDRTLKGHLGAFPSGIRDVTRVLPWKFRRKMCSQLEVCSLAISRLERTIDQRVELSLGTERAERGTVLAAKPRLAERVAHR